MSQLKELVEFSKSLTVLYVEDDMQIRENYFKVFKEFFFHVDIAENGKIGLDSFSNTQYDLIITDINMPVMNGINMIENILESNPEQSIIVTSAHDESQYLLNLIELGIEKFLIKPIEFSKLIIVLTRSCKRIAEKKELKAYQSHMEEENLNTAKLLKALKKKNIELEQSLHQLRREENIAITLVDGIEKEKDFSENELDFFSPSIDTLCAKDFVETYAGDMDTLNDHLESIEETLELLIHQKLLSPTPESFEVISSAFYDYGSHLAQLYKFANLSEALQNFATVLAKEEDINLLKEMKPFLFGIADSLGTFRQEVLVLQTAQDIHFLDNSIISDCMQTESMLTNNQDTDDNLDELFF